MGTRKFVVLQCDQCQRDEGEIPVATKTIAIDGTTVEAELCEECWQSVLEPLAVFLRAGRRIPARTKLRNVKPWPGTSWRFTSHALIRCGERGLDPLEICDVIEDPSITRPGKASDQEIRERNGVKAVVVPERGIIVTVARKGEEAVDDYTADRVS